MVIQIPANFSSLLKENNTTEINYFINQANSSLAKQIMEGAAKDITQTVNKMYMRINKSLFHLTYLTN